MIFVGVLLMRFHGACLGERLNADAPFGKCNTRTFIAALICSGLVAPRVITGTINGVAFATRVASRLAPILKPAEVVVWDNFNVHKSPRAAQAVRQRGPGFGSCPDTRPA